MRNLWVILAVLTTSLWVFHLKVGIQKVATNNDDWLLIRTTDRLPDYLTFIYFQKVDLENYPDTLNYSFPQRVSPIYTNIIPLVSYPVKWLGIGDTERFQYWGFWFLFCFILQGIMAYLFLRALGVKDHINIFLGSCFIILSVPLLFRLDHPALVHHWTVIAGIIPFFTHWKNRMAFGWFTVLAIISATTHPYMLPFGSGLPLLYGIHQWLRRGKLSIWDIAIPASAIGVSVFLLWSMGAFGFDVSTAAGGGFGYYSANLNTFYNNFGLTNAPLDFDTYHDGAYEGMAYLGLGVLVLMLINMVAYRKKGQMLKTLFSKNWLVLTLGIFSFTFFAFSDVWTFHEMILVSWPDDWGEKYFGIFRSSGRYIWLAFYLLIGLVIYGWTKLPIRKAWIRSGLLLALLIQIWDVYPILTDRIPEDSRIDEFENENWEDVFSPFDLIVTYPPYQRTLYENDDASHMVFIASKKAQPITAGHLPRPDFPSQYAFQKDLEQWLNSDNANTLEEKYRNTLFVTTVGYLPIFDHAIKKEFLRVWQKGNYVFLANPEFVSENKNLSDYWRSFNVDRVIHLKDWMEMHDHGHMIIVGQDESTSHAGKDFLDWMENKNSQFAQVSFRDAYFGWFQNGIIQQEIWHEESISDTIRIYGDQWIVHSEGNRAGNNSYVIINGQKYDDLRRGLNIFHIEEGSDTITLAHFDTYETPILQKEERILLTPTQN